MPPQLERQVIARVEDDYTWIKKISTGEFSEGIGRLNSGIAFRGNRESLENVQRLQGADAEELVSVAMYIAEDYNNANDRDPNTIGNYLISLYALDPEFPDEFTEYVAQICETIDG